MLKKKHFENDMETAFEIIHDPKMTLEDKLSAVLHAIEMVGKRTFDNAQNEVAIMEALKIKMVADRLKQEEQ